jgi:hypothetical protein
MLGNSWVAERLAASQEELSSMKLVSEQKRSWLLQASFYPIILRWKCYGNSKYLWVIKLLFPLRNSLFYISGSFRSHSSPSFVMKSSISNSPSLDVSSFCRRGSSNRGMAIYSFELLYYLFNNAYNNPDYIASSRRERGEKANWKLCERKRS